LGIKLTIDSAPRRRNNVNMAIDIDLLDRSLALPERDRAQLAHELLASLDHEDAGEDGAEECLAGELDRRCDQIDRGEVALQDHQTSIRLARQALRGRSGK
jgi:hypothetical protein